MLIGGSSDKYGNRLDGIDKVKISNETFEGVKKEVTYMFILTHHQLLVIKSLFGYNSKS